MQFPRVQKFPAKNAAQQLHCARIEFQNEESREIDAFFLLRKSFPVIIECKSGEFRHELEKYRKLRQRLGMDKSQFVICNPDLTNEEVTGLTSMYDLTFVNLQSFATHIETLAG